MGPRNLLQFTALALGYFFFGLVCLQAQEMRVRKVTTLERYDQALVIPHEERLAMKQERQEELERRRAMLDTMEVSRHKRLRLLRELYRKPSGDLWANLLAQPDTLQVKEQ
ncbi:hypothetical protein [Robiginitalea sediminis]|uniref:hypothetical protein n=1 Tax=Robiginitalea sediminis TaxID=1982593 RepID=UPI000B4C093A|nr:hypothetical protein [Robiginitalea sediminis]